MTFDGCRVVSGSWMRLDPGSGNIIDAGSLDVDHMVPLGQCSPIRWLGLGCRNQAGLRKRPRRSRSPDRGYGIGEPVQRSEGPGGLEAYQYVVLVRVRDGLGSYKGYVGPVGDCRKAGSGGYGKPLYLRR